MNESKNLRRQLVCRRYHELRHKYDVTNMQYTPDLEVYKMQFSFRASMCLPDKQNYYYVTYKYRW